LIVLDPLYALITIGLLLTITVHLDHVTVRLPRFAVHSAT